VLFPPGGAVDVAFSASDELLLVFDVGSTP
jgi:hypothetical protein